MRSQNLLGYYFVLRQLKSSELFLQYFILIAFRIILDIQRPPNLFELVSKAMKGVKIHFPTFPAIGNLRILFKKLKIYSTWKPSYYRYLDSLRDFRVLIELWDQLAPPCLKHFKRLDKFRLPNFSKITRDYEDKYKEIIREHQHEIIKWADLAITRLHNRSKKKLLKDFSNTTEEELKQFKRKEAVQKYQDVR